MKVTQFGEGKKSILIIHGWMHSSKWYNRIAGELGQDNRVFLVDLPGFSGEKAPGCDNILDYYTQETVELMNSHKFDLIIGHSTGGAVLIRAMHDPALKYSNKVILANPAYAGIGYLKPIVYFWRFCRFIFFLASKAPLFIAKPIIKIVALVSIRRWKMIDDLLVDDCRSSDPHVAAKLAKELVFDKFRWTTDNEFKSITIFRSEYDRLISNKNIDLLAEDIGECEIVEFKNIGHTSVTEDYPMFLKNTKAVLETD